MTRLTLALLVVIIAVGCSGIVMRSTALLTIALLLALAAHAVDVVLASRHMRHMRTMLGKHVAERQTEHAALTRTVKTLDERLHAEVDRRTSEHRAHGIAMSTLRIRHAADLDHARAVDRATFAALLAYRDGATADDAMSALVTLDHTV